MMNEGYQRGELNDSRKLQGYFYQVLIPIHSININIFCCLQHEDDHSPFFLNQLLEFMHIWKISR